MMNIRTKITLPLSVFILCVSLLAPPSSPIKSQAPLDFALVQTLGRGTAESIAWSPDGETLAVGESQGIWLYTKNLQNAELVEIGLPLGITLIEWSPNSRYLAAVSSSQLLIWDGQDNDMVRILDHANSPIHAVAWSPDGQYLATASHNPYIRIWQTPNWLSQDLVGHRGIVNALAWNPQIPTQLLSGSDDTSARIWDISSASEMMQLTLPHVVQAVAWSPDGTSIATGGAYQEIVLWNPTTGQVQSRLNFPADVATDIRYLVWDADSQRLIASDAIHIGLWHPDNPDPLYTIANAVTHLSPRPHSGQFSVIHSGQISIYATMTGKIEHTLFSHSESASSLAWFSDDMLYTASTNIWRISDGRLMSHIPYPAAQWSPDWRFLASIDEQSSLQIIDWSEAKAQFPDNPMQGELPILTPIVPLLSGHPDVYAVAWSPDSDFIASLEFGRAHIRISTSATWELASILQDPSLFIAETLAWASTSNLLAVGGQDLNGAGIIQIWDMNQHSLRISINSATSSVMQLAWHPQGASVASTHGDGSTSIWRLDQPSPLNLEPASGQVSSLAWSPDAKFLAAGSGQEILIWYSNTGTLATRLSSTQGFISDIAWSPDSSKIASAGEDGTIHIWGQVQD